VPKDFTINGKRETFTVTVVYDTMELYGTVKASRQITVTAQ
jgi:hypothetical protein